MVGIIAFVFLYLIIPFYIKKIYTFCGLQVKEKMTTKIKKQIEERIHKKICVSEMNIDIGRFIKELRSLNLGPNDLEAVLNSIKGLDVESRLELIDRLLMFNEFADELSIKLVLWP